MDECQNCGDPCDPGESLCERCEWAEQCFDDGPLTDDYPPDETCPEFFDLGGESGTA